LELSRSFFLCFRAFIYVLFYLDMYLVYLVWTCAFIEELILWFGTYFEVGMNLYMDNFVYDITVIFGKLCIYFMVDIRYISLCVWYVMC